MTISRTQKAIKEEMEKAQQQLSMLTNPYINSPEIARIKDTIHGLKNQLYDLEHEYEVSIQADAEFLREKIQNLRQELKDIKLRNEFQISDDLKKWFRNYLSGINFGYKSPKIVWASPDEHFIIMTSPGGTAGTGTAMGTGAYYYAPSEHYLIDTRQGTNWTSRNNGRLVSVEGKLTKEIKAEWLKKIEDINKQNEI